jgi:hypothetical protein
MKETFETTVSALVTFFPHLKPPWQANILINSKNKKENNLKGRMGVAFREVTMKKKENVTPQVDTG